MIKAAVIGFPIHHSKSPLIHGHWLKQNNIDGNYTAIEISPNDLGSQIQVLKEAGFAGFNVTIPHKTTMLQHCDEIEETARAIGAVNTVEFTADGKIIGRNTDAFGFIENLKEKCPNFDFNSKSASILGAGGAARACAYGLLKAGIKRVDILNRTQQKAIDIADQLTEFGNITAGVWNDRNNFSSDTGLVANTTSLGMVGQPPLDIDLTALQTDAVVYDIVYNPLMTDLLTQAQSRGLKTVTGIGMLIHQARPGFKIWFKINDLPTVSPQLEQDILNA